MNFALMTRGNLEGIIKAFDAWLEAQPDTGSAPKKALLRQIRVKWQEIIKII